MIDYPEETDYLEETLNNRIIVTGKVVLSEHNNKIKKILIFNGEKKDESSFLGEANFFKETNLSDNPETKFQNNNTVLYEFEIPTFYLEDGVHELYVYAYDEYNNYSFSKVKVNILKKNKFKVLENTSSFKLVNGEEYDFKDFIFNGILTVKRNSEIKKYDFFLTTSDMPIVIINTNNRIITYNNLIDANMKIIYKNFNEKNFIDATVFDFNGKISIRVRGHGTRYSPKKQYSIEIIDNNGNDKKVLLLGLPKESDWILSAPYNDKSLIRMALAFELSNQMGLYAPRTKFIEVFLDKNAKNLKGYDYVGVYVLTESIKQGKNRVNIAKLESDDDNLISGGYILETTSKDLYNPHETYFETPYYQYIIKYPNWNKITEKQKKWIINYINKFEEVIYGNNFNDTENGYLKYIDINSFIDYIIINELFKNRVVIDKSTFITKDRNGKLKLGPIWDFDLSSGIAYSDPKVKQNLTEGFELTNELFCKKLFQDPYFVNKYI